MQVRDLIKELERYPATAEVQVRFLYDAVPDMDENFQVEKVETDAGEPVIVAVEI